MVNKKYLTGLSEKEKEEKIKNIRKTRELLKKGDKKAALELSKKRPTTQSKRKSSYTIKFKEKFPNVKIKTKEFEKVTGIPVKIQKEIIKRGRAHF